MKNTIKLIGFAVLAVVMARVRQGRRRGNALAGVFASQKLLLLLLAGTLIVVGCGNGSTNTPKTVEAKYQFSGYEWQDFDLGVIPGAVAKLDKNSFSVQDGGVSISYTGVYTEGGGIFDWGATWAYVYDGSGKIGIAIYTSDDNKELFFGQTRCALNMTSFTDNGQTLVVTDMQDTCNGAAWPN